MNSVNLDHDWSVRKIKIDDCLSLTQMKDLDHHAIEKYHLPIELMMENAGYHLALLTNKIVSKSSAVMIGCGPGNNGGGGLVAARRLAGWGHTVYIDIPSGTLNDLPAKQLKRALAFGVKKDVASKPDVAIDAYFGFSQRLPIEGTYAGLISKMHDLNCPIISLDIPTGIAEIEEQQEGPFIKCQVICTLAAPKQLLFSKYIDARIFVVDLGIPNAAYTDLQLKQVSEFENGPIWEMVTKN